jgi:hypothetical protein
MEGAAEPAQSGGHGVMRPGETRVSTVVRAGQQHTPALARPPTPVTRSSLKNYVLVSRYLVQQRANG